MKTQKINKYVKYFILIVLVSYLWSNALSNVVLINNKNLDAIELSLDKDIEENSEEDIKKELGDKIVFNSFFNLKFYRILKNKIIQIKNYSSLNYLEINLPPPKFIFLL